MGIYLPNMEMPDKCGHCRFANAFDCTVTGSFISTHSIRQPDCPLVPVPPHGRLIEDTAVREQIDEWLDSVGDVVVGHGLSYYGELLGCIEDAPTIIEAEEGE